MVYPWYTKSHLFLCEMIKIFLASTSTTGTSECLDSRLAKICCKDWNNVLVKNLEILYLLTSLKSYESDYNEIDLQMKN